MSKHHGEAEKEILCGLHDDLVTFFFLSTNAPPAPAMRA